MAYIYKITNKINGKSYIGKTLSSIEERWQNHIRDSKKESCKDRPLYKAFAKYGIENFFIEKIEECSAERANEKEVYWIEYYSTFKEGYNATIGGDGTHYLDYDLICETYKQVQNAVKTAEICGCHPDSVKRILKEKKIEITLSSEIIKKETSKMINQYDLKNNYIKTFPSINDAARYIQSLSLERVNLSGIAQHIAAVAKGKRKTAYKFIWKFIE